MLLSGFVHYLKLSPSKPTHLPIDRPTDRPNDRTTERTTDRVLVVVSCLNWLYCVVCFFRMSGPLEHRASCHALGDMVVEQCYENQRYSMENKAFSSSFLAEAERSKFSEDNGEPAAYHPTRGRPTEAELIGGWAWINEWSVDLNMPDTDAAGWLYAPSWEDYKPEDDATSVPFIGADSANCGPSRKVLPARKQRFCKDAKGATTVLDLVRKRRWTRTRKVVAEQPTSHPSSTLPDDSTLPFPRGPLEGGEHCWSEPNVAKCFELRGKSYMRDWRKIPANEALFKLRSIDFFQTEETDVTRYDNFASHPDSYVQKAIRAGDTTSYFIVVHFQMQPHHMCCTWIYDEAKVEAAGPHFETVWDRFINGEDDYRDSRFKVIPSVAEGNWLIRRSVGAKPALLAKKLKHRYKKTPRYFEIDCDVNSSYLAGSIVSVLKSYAYLLSIDLGLTIEGRSSAELPEVVFACFRLTKPNLEQMRWLDNSKGVGNSRDIPDVETDVI
eukprot:CFRG4891T1